MSRTTKARVFVPLMKVDEEQRLVFGKITAQEVDQSGEVMDYETSKPNFEKWSADIEKGSGGLSKGNLRVMHGLSVAGKLTDISYDDDNKAIEVCAKVVDDAEWNKVIEGCYTGFSVGGRYAKKWDDVVDGEKVKKFTAVPNEVSLVDNPCVKSATFQLIKADNVVEDVMFKTAETPAEEGATEETETVTVDVPVEEQPVEKGHTAPVAGEPTSAAVAAKAEELAKAANDGTTWADHIEKAREELMKTSALGLAVEQEREAKENAGTSGEAKAEEEAEPERGTEDTPTDENTADPDDGPAEKVTPSGVKQKWEASDGKTFEKKDDAIAHEAELQKAAEPKTDADVLRARLDKALKPEPVEADPELMDDFDRLAKAVQVLETVAADGFKPDELKKGMYTISRFSDVLASVARLAKSIKGEGEKEGDESDTTVSASLKSALGDMATSFKTYVDNQITELLAGMDDDDCVACYDYYCCAAQENGEDQLAKDVSSLIAERRDASRERRDVLAKAFGIEELTVEVDSSELSPPMQKRFDELEAENKELKKVAEDAVGKVEELAKRVQTIEDTPLPRAPKNIAYLGGDGTFFGKKAETDEEKTAILKGMLEAEGPDALATKLIKAAQQNPITLFPQGRSE